MWWRHGRRVSCCTPMPSRRCRGWTRRSPRRRTWCRSAPTSSVGPRESGPCSCATGPRSPRGSPAVARSGVGGAAPPMWPAPWGWLQHCWPPWRTGTPPSHGSPPCGTGWVTGWLPGYPIWSNRVVGRIGWQASCTCGSQGSRPRRWSCCWTRPGSPCRRGRRARAGRSNRATSWHRWGSTRPQHVRGCDSLSASPPPTRMSTVHWTGSPAPSSACETRDVRVLVAMSGGVDSSVAAALLVDRLGTDHVVGATLKLWGGDSDSGCCSVADVDDARRVADQLGIVHHVFNFSEEFETHVVEPYVAGHAAGTTPNPCIECNRHLKFDRLVERSNFRWRLHSMH